MLGGITIRMLYFVYYVMQRPDCVLVLNVRHMCVRVQCPGPGSVYEYASSSEIMKSICTCSALSAMSRAFFIAVSE
jgi:hypothetical protein